VLVGPYGVGKFAQALGYATEILGVEERIEQNPDLMIVDIIPSKSSITLDQIKEASGFLAVSPMYAKEKVLIFNNADFINDEGQNALLKVVEEPSKSSRIFFVSSFGKLLPTILSRCQTINVHEPELSQDLEWQDLIVLDRSRLKNKMKSDLEFATKYLDSIKFFVGSTDLGLADISKYLEKILVDENMSVLEYVFGWYSWLRIMLLEKITQTGYDVSSDLDASKQNWLAKYNEKFLVEKMYELEEMLELVLFSNVKNDIILENYLLGLR
jgi:DNA polymerase III delta prime subunit